MELEKEIMGLLDRTARIETSIETLLKQQTAIDSLAKSVQQLALSISEINGETHRMSERLTCVEDEGKKRSFYIWSIVVGGVVGAVISYISTII